jgi:ubiquinone/menaquinone biosynthesis C-methylase UbiE
LDLACGSGAMALHLAAHGANDVIGVDISKTFIDELEGQELPGNVHFIQGDLARLAEIEDVSASSTSFSSSTLLPTWTMSSRR